MKRVRKIVVRFDTETWTLEGKEAEDWWNIVHCAEYQAHLNLPYNFNWSKERNGKDA